MTLIERGCDVVAVGGWMPSTAAFVFQAVAAVIVAAVAGTVNRRGVLAMADLEMAVPQAGGSSSVGGGWAGRPVAQWEARAVVAMTWASVLAAWVAACGSVGWWSSQGCSAGLQGMLAPLVAGVGAAGAAFVLVDDLRHHGVEVEPVAVCFAAAILWRWLGSGGIWFTGEAAVVGVLTGGGFWALNAGLRRLGKGFGNGDWLLIAAAAAWIGTALWGWVAFLAVQVVMSAGFHLLVREQSAPLGPGAVVGVVAALVVTAMVT